MGYIRQTKRSREATHGFAVYTEADARIDHPHATAADLRRIRRELAAGLAPAGPALAPAKDADRPPPLRQRLRDAARRPKPGA